MAFCSSWLWSSSLPAITPKCRASTPRIDSGAATARLVANGSVTVATPMAVRKWRRSRDMGGLASFVRALPSPSCAPDRLCRDGTAVFRLTAVALYRRIPDERSDIRDPAFRFGHAGLQRPPGRHKAKQNGFAGAGEIGERPGTATAARPCRPVHQRHMDERDDRDLSVARRSLASVPIKIVAQIGTGIARQSRRNARRPCDADQLLKRRTAGERCRLARANAIALGDPPTRIRHQG